MKNEFPDEAEQAYKDLLTPRGKKVLAWFKKPLKKVGQLYNVKFVTIRPFPFKDWFADTLGEGK